MAMSVGVAVVVAGGGGGGGGGKGSGLLRPLSFLFSQWVLATREARGWAREEKGGHLVVGRAEILPTDLYMVVGRAEVLPTDLYLVIGRA